MIKICSCCARVFRVEEDFFTDTFYWRLDSEGNIYFTCSCSSTLMVKRGKHDWYSPEKTLSSETARIFNALSIGKLIPQIPQGITQLQRILNKQDIDINEVSRALKFEPMVLSEVLKIANLMSRSSSNIIKTIEHAVVYMGLRALRDLVAAAALRSLEFKSERFSFDEFWEESFVAARLAELLCREISANVSTDEVYLAACLANSGKVLYATCFPDMADKVFHLARTSKISWRAAEISLNFPDHGILGEIAGAFWSLPHYVVDACLNHHLPRSSRTRVAESGKMNAIVVLANQLKNIVFDREYEVDEELVQDSLRLLGVSRKKMEDFIVVHLGIRGDIKDGLLTAG